METERGAARRMVNQEGNEPSEAEEARERERWQKYHEILWQHIEGCHERYSSDMEAGNGHGAFGETQVLMQLGKAYFEG